MKARKKFTQYPHLQTLYLTTPRERTLLLLEHCKQLLSSTFINTVPIIKVLQHYTRSFHDITWRRLEQSAEGTKNVPDQCSEPLLLCLQQHAFDKPAKVYDTNHQFHDKKVTNRARQKAYLVLQPCFDTRRLASLFYLWFGVDHLFVRHVNI